MTLGDGAEQIPELCRRICRGDTDAEQSLYLICKRPITALLQHWAGPDDAEDLAQDALLILLERLRRQQIVDPTRAYGFLVGIARRLVYAHRRRLSRQKIAADSVQLDELASTTPGVEQSIERSQLRQSLWSLVNQLPIARDRATVTNLFLLEQNRADVCAELDLSPSQLSRVLYRSRQRLTQLALDQRDELFGLIP